MSALGHKHDVRTAKRHVCFTPESGHVQCTSRCLLWANSGHAIPHNHVGLCYIIILDVRRSYVWRVSMTPLEKPSRKCAARSMLPQTKLVMLSVFFVTVVTTAAAPVLTDASAGSQGTGYTTGHRAKKHLETRHDNIPTVFPKHPRRVTMEIGALLPVAISGTAIICGAVRSDFGTPTRRPVPFALASVSELPAQHFGRAAFK